MERGTGNRMQEVCAVMFVPSVLQGSWQPVSHSAQAPVLPATLCNVALSLALLKRERPIGSVP